MGFVTSSTDGSQVWSYRERDQVIDYFSDQFRTAAERLARRVEEYLFDRRSPNYSDPVFLSWAVAQFDHEKTGSGGPGHNVEFNRDVAERASAFSFEPGETVIPRRKQDAMVHVPGEQLDFLKEGDA